MPVHLCALVTDPVRHQQTREEMRRARERMQEEYTRKAQESARELEAKKRARKRKDGKEARKRNPKQLTPTPGAFRVVMPRWAASFVCPLVCGGGEDTHRSLVVQVARWTFVAQAQAASSADHRRATAAAVVDDVKPRGLPCAHQVRRFPFPLPCRWRGCASRRW